jgi:hypothetical protein
MDLLFYRLFFTSSKKTATADPKTITAPFPGGSLAEQLCRCGEQLVLPGYRPKDIEKRSPIGLRNTLVPFTLDFC